MRGRDVAVKEEGQEKTLERVRTWVLSLLAATSFSCQGALTHKPARKGAYYSRPNQFERFRGFWNELADSNSIFFVANFFLNGSNFWCVHVNVPWLV